MSTTRFVIDPSHSSITFGVRHMMITTVRGEFTRFAGAVTLTGAEPTSASVEATIEVASIHTREEKRDAHLRSADFFDAEAHPEMSFRSTAVTASGDGYELTGELTLRGTSRAVKLLVSDVTPEHTDPWGNLRVGASAKGKLKRSDFGMTWNAALEAGGLLVGDEVSLQLDVSLIKQA